jgi:hypothetical protein
MKEGRRQQEEQALVMKEHDFGRQNRCDITQIWVSGRINAGRDECMKG